MKKGLYYSGMAAGIFYMIGDILGGLITPNYNYINNAVSEFIQSGAENRALLSPFLFLHALMIVLFSIAIMVHHSYKNLKSIYIGGILLLILGLCHALSSTLFPMDPAGTEMTFPGVIHLILVGISVVAIFLLMPLIGNGLHRLYQWKSFRVFTFVCLAVIIISGVSSPVVIVKNIQIMGLTERITGYAFYLWLFVLAYRLIRKLPKQILGS